MSRGRTQRRKAARAAVVPLLAAMLMSPAPSGASHPPVPMSLGSFSAGGTTSDCPSEFSCRSFSVTCSGVQQKIGGVLATAKHSGKAKGAVVLFSGSGGSAWWTEGSGADVEMLGRLRTKGLTVMMVRWKTAWLASAPGERAGPAHLACRPATAIKWIHDNVYVPLGVDPQPGVCGFCISGNSGGASQVSYAISHYGLENILDAVIPTSGPPHAALVKGCLRRAGEEEWWFGGEAPPTIDSSYGFGKQGPCTDADASYTARWRRDAVDTGGDHNFPRTRIHVIVGGNDPSSAVEHAQDFLKAAEDGGSPWVAEQLVARMPHRLQASADGVNALEAAILAKPGDPVPSDTGAGGRRRGEQGNRREQVDPRQREGEKRERLDPSLGDPRRERRPDRPEPTAAPTRDADWWWLFAVLGLIVFGSVALPRISRRLRASTPDS